MQFLQTENDFTTTLTKALDEVDPKWKNYTGLIIAGSHSPDLIDEKIEAIKNARENNIPFLGICMGMQLMAIEYARNVLKKENATSEELSDSGYFAVKELPDRRTGIYIVEWRGERRMETHWHQYHVDMEVFSDGNWETSCWENIPEVARLMGNTFFMGVQFHPEYQSSKKNPHWLLKNFLHICRFATGTHPR